MIRLKISREPRWLDLAHGVRVKVTPLTTAIYRAAVSTAYRKAVEFAYERGLIEDAGGRVSDIPDADDQDGINGLRQQFVLQDLAVHAIIEWSGVGDDQDEPLAFTKAGARVLMRDFPLIAAEFENQYLYELNELEAEKNASRAAPNGTSEAAQNTAGDAETTVSPALTPEERERESSANIENIPQLA